VSTDPVATEPTPPVADHPAETWKPRTLHLGWLLGASVAVVSILCLLVWSGALAPRISSGFMRTERTDRTLVVHASIRNDASTTVVLTGITAPPGLALRSAVLTRPNGHTTPESRPATTLGDLATEDVDLGPHAAARTTITYEIVSCRAATTQDGRVEVDARTFLGITRQAEVVENIYWNWNVTGMGHAPRTACEGETDP